MRKLLFLLCIMISSHAAKTQKIHSAPFAHTFSIVAYDENAGEMAVAVQSHWFSVGTVVSWGEAGVGVVATQSFVNKSFGIRGLELLKQGKTPQEALDILLSDDPGKEVRQVAILDTHGNVATHTGKNCIPEASQIKSKGYSVQANMMLNKDVVPAMSAAFEKYKDLPLAERLVEVLKAAQKAGGDIRGKQSAALLVVPVNSSGKPWDDRLVDIRVDDNAEPISELERILKVHRAYEHMNKGDFFAEKNDMPGAMKEYDAAMQMFPENLEMQYWTAITLANNKKVNEALPVLKKVYAADPHWRELTKRLPKVGLLSVSEQELKLLLQ